MARCPAIVAANGRLNTCDEITFRIRDMFPGPEKESREAPPPFTSSFPTCPGDRLDPKSLLCCFPSGPNSPLTTDPLG